MKTITLLLAVLITINVKATHIYSYYMNDLIIAATNQKPEIPKEAVKGYGRKPNPITIE